MNNRTSLSEKSLRGAVLSTHNPVHSEFINNHFVIEAELEDLIRSQFRDPDRFKVKDMGFPRKVKLARALAGPQPDDHIWDIVLKFNETRNTIAHRKKKLPQENFAELRGLVTKALPALDVSDDTQTMLSALRICIWFIRDIKQSLPQPIN